MAIDLKGRNFLTMLDFSREEILAVLQTARELKERFKGMMAGLGIPFKSR